MNTARTRPFTCIFFRPLSKSRLLNRPCLEHHALVRSERLRFVEKPGRVGRGAARSSVMFPYAKSGLQ